MQLYYIRHGQSVNNALWEAQNYDGMKEDPELTPMGEAQAKALAVFLRDEGHDAWRRAGTEEEVPATEITHLYSSLMIRAVQTGSYIADAIDVPLEGLMDLHEMGGMRFRKRPEDEYISTPGQNGNYFRKYFPGLKLPKDVKPDQGWWEGRPPESREECWLRASRFLNDLLIKHGGTDDVVALVSHGAFFKYLAAAILNLPAISHLWLNHFNTGVSRFIFEDGRVNLDFMNRLNHLTYDLYSG